MREVMPDDAILLCDVGDHHGWMTKFWKGYQPRTQFQPWGFASMAFAVCGLGLNWLLLIGSVSPFVGMVDL
jgi:acetolactate synthase-1/2/3 large subunit